MARRRSFTWNPSTILILVVATTIVVLGAAYLTQISKQIGSGLGAFVAGGITSPPDSRCEPGSTEVTLGTVIYKYRDTLAIPFKDGSRAAKTVDEAKETLLLLALRHAQASSCTKSYNKAVASPLPPWPNLPGKTPSSIGTIQLPESIPALTEKELSDAENMKLTCTSKKESDNSLQCALPNTCQRRPGVISCMNTIRGIPEKTDDPKSDCVVDPLPARGANGIFQGGTVTCTVRYKATAICDCKKEEVSIPDDPNFVSTPIPAVIMTPIPGTQTPVPNSGPPLTI